MYSFENAGTLDLTSELELWTKSGKLNINLSKSCDNGQGFTNSQKPYLTVLK